MARAGRIALWAGVAIAPVLAYMFLRGGVVSDPTWAVPDLHFFIVSLTSLVSCFMAVLLVIAAGQLRDARVIFLSLAFLAISGIFAVHGLTTPNALFDGNNPWVGFSGRLSLLLGAAFFAPSTIDRNSRLHDLVVRRQALITVTFVAFLGVYATVAIVDVSGGGAVASSPQPAGESAPSSGYDSYAAAGAADTSAFTGSSQAESSNSEEWFWVLQSDSLSLATTIVALLLFAIVTIHYGRLYLRFPSPMLLSIALSSAFLLQAQYSMSFAPKWQASWWEYHILMLSAFAVVVVGLAMEFKQSGTLHGVVAGLLVRDTIDQLQRGYTDVIVALVNAVEAKDVYTRGHTQRVTDLAVRIGEELRLSSDRLRILSQSAMLHDIGKIGVPDAILNKPGRLTDAEFDVIKQHPVRGHAIIKEVRSLQAALGGIRHHHERLDGSGYPDSLKGDAIPLEARIIAVADVFDALTSARSYRDAWPVSRAMDEIQRDAGHGLDATCVAALNRVMQHSGQRAMLQLPVPTIASEPTHSVAASSVMD